MYQINELEDIGPHTSECTISSITLALLSLLGNVFFLFFHCAHPFQIPSLFSWINGSLSTTFLVIGSGL